MSAVSFLISDPSHALQTFARQLLVGYGFDAASIKTTDDPHAAAQVAKSFKPDFLLTDWFATESLSGIGLYQAILKSHPTCHFALLSQTNDAAHVQQADEAGAMFLLAKPFAANDLRREMGKTLEQLARLHPQIARQIHASVPVHERPAPIQLPRLPQFKPGDRVLYANRTESVKHVILRHGELLVQLDGIAGLVEASKVSRL